MLLYLAI